ncbi:MAG: hypothetical protein MRJ96_15045 [Nitrospirales bacterium]|nr:hypothetical protein [Nitrospira sp.]MDR4502758.1 hypothetical protein [Nitrospirales bacterium]
MDNIKEEVKLVKAGLALVLVGLLFGVMMGITFGINEDLYKGFIADGIAAHPTIHDAKSQEKIWRYAQRAHFHATGIAAFALGLISLVMFSDLKPKMKSASSFFLGLSSFYPFAWFTMFALAPSIGRGAAHSHILTETFAMIGVGGLLLGSFLLVANLFGGMFGNKTTPERQA